MTEFVPPTCGGMYANVKAISHAPGGSQIMEPVPIYESNYTIPNRDVDFMKRLKLGALFGYIQDISSLHSENIGTGVAHLANDLGVAWVLMRMRVDILRAPMLYEEIKLSTWPQPTGKALYDRDFTIAAADGEIIVRGSSVWILMDLEKRELVKGNILKYADVEFPTTRALTEKLGRIHMPKGARRVFDHEVHYSDIDYNGHMNNTKYVDIVMDGVGVDVLRDYEPASIEVNYSNEIHPGEILTLYKDDSALVSDGIIYAEARGDIGGESDLNLFTGKVRLRRG
jgi:acyl-ACP thioesterase